MITNENLKRAQVRNTLEEFYRADRYPAAADDYDE